MLLWFVALSCAGVLLVFDDPAIDFRMVAIGSVAPDVVDGVIRRGTGPAHTLLAAVGLMTAVMVATAGRRRVRKPLMMLCIGVLGHLVLDGVWSRPALFWWPLVTGGLDGPLPSFDRFPLALAQEAIGAGVLVWFAKRVRLDSAGKVRSFVLTGKVPA